MMINVICPDCSKSYKLSSDTIGKKVRCKVCNTTFPVTGTEDSACDTEELAAPSRKTSPVKKPVPSSVKKPKASSEDDEFAGLNSVSSDGESLDELPDLPARPKRKSRKTDDDEDEAPPKKKRKASRSGSGWGGPVPAIVAACAGGGAGAIIWGAIVIFSQHEIGWIAWGIGLLVGVCVRFAAGDMDESTAGIIAAVGSAVSILGGKSLVALLIVGFLPVEEMDAVLVNMTSAQRFFHLLMGTFGPVDIVFFVLAIITAYRVGANRQEGA